MNDAPRCVIIGGGGHARVLIDCLQQSGAATVVGIVDPDSTRWGQDMLGVPILGGDDRLGEIRAMGVAHFAVGLGSVGDNRPRTRLYDLGLQHQLEPLTVIHSSAICSPWAQLDAGAQVLALGIINAGATLGKNVIVNSGAIVEHDCKVGDHVHIAIGVQLSGGVLVGNGAHIGAGATVIQSVAIGEGAVIGAGAVVVTDIPPYTVAVGVPAKPLRKVNSPEILWGGAAT